MADQTTEDIEFIPSDEIAEAEPDETEQGAVHIEEREEPRGLMIVEATQLEGAEAEVLELEAEAEELEAEAAAAGEAERKEAEEEETEEEVEEEADEEHEEDLEETLRRHYGIVSEEPEQEPAAEERGLRTPGAGEFVCRSCFLRKAASQLSDPARGLCADCVANGVSAA
jgi:hypothetical protein